MFMLIGFQQYGKSPKRKLQDSLRERKCDLNQTSKYAIVSLFTENPYDMETVPKYTQCASKLARSIRSWMPSGVDLILMTTETISHEMGGWQICEVNALYGKYHIEGNRFHESKMFSKLNVWRLVQYEALVFIDLDMLGVGNMSGLFDNVWPTMQSLNLEFAAATDRPTKDASWRDWCQGKCKKTMSRFNAGLFLFRPSLERFEELKKGMDEGHYDMEYCEQGLLNSFYGRKYDMYELPFKYNVNVVSKYCEPDVWTESEKEFVFIHYTVAKPWRANSHCVENGVLEECLLWESF